MKINNDLTKYKTDNTFSRTKGIVSTYKNLHPNVELISLGIGDVSKPIPQPSIDAMRDALTNLETMDNFPGYGSYYGNIDLRKTILDNDYKQFGFNLEEIYIGNGAKSDAGNILELFDKNSLIGVGDIMYPIYENSCVAMNRTIMPIKTNKELKCMPPWDMDFDIIYLCSPNNPVGNAYTYDELKEWLSYCNQHNTVIIYDNVYEPFIRSDNCPHSIYEIPGMEYHAIELRSFSKKASFTGMRCSYYILPRKLYPDITYYWQERTLNRFNGASYLAQVGAKATYLPEAQIIIKNNIAYYHNNADILKKGFIDAGFEIIGGEDAPFMLVKNKDNMTSWESFYWFLNNFGIIVIPGAIFGKAGDGYCRLSALGPTEDIIKAIQRVKEYYEKQS